MENKTVDMRKSLQDMIHKLHVISLENDIYVDNESTDISDFGNEIGIIVGKVFPQMTEEEINDFIIGFTHGVSLTNGTH